jgi:hypothetical protein
MSIEVSTSVTPSLHSRFDNFIGLSLIFDGGFSGTRLSLLSVMLKARQLA